MNQSLRICGSTVILDCVYIAYNYMQHFYSGSKFFLYSLLLYIISLLISINECAAFLGQVTVSIRTKLNSGSLLIVCITLYSFFYPLADHFSASSTGLLFHRSNHYDTPNNFPGYI